MINIYLRKLCIAPIRLYQWCISPFLPRSCRFYPTCSAYAAEAIALHGIFKGFWLALRRILRCHPLCAGGFDPVPPRPDRAAEQCTEQLGQTRRTCKPELTATNLNIYLK